MASRLSLLPGEHLSDIRTDREWADLFAGERPHRSNVSRNATKKNCLRGGNIYASGRFDWE